MPFSAAHPSLLAALTRRGYVTPTPVQLAVMGDEARGRDLLVSAQTGSGKTVAFGLAMADLVLADPPGGPPRALVVAPTRELAQQVQRELAWLYEGLPVVTCVGGMDPRREQRDLRQGAAIVVGTPGRLRDHLERKALDLSAVRAVVLDEADEMLDMGFREEIEALLDATPATRRTLLFSATVPSEIEAIARRYQQDALRLSTVGEDEPHGDITYRAAVVAPRDRENAVVNVLRYLDPPGALVFCATREGTTRLHANLVERGFAAVALSGELSQAERNRALQALRDGRARVCVATDVAARGIDLPALGLVIHADLPREPAVLLHRSGRTGRAGRKGTAVLIVPANRRRAAERMVQAAGVEATWSAPPTAEAIQAKDEERLLTQLKASVEEVSEEDRVLARKLVAEVEAEGLVAALVHARRAALPAPEEIGPAPKVRRDEGVGEGYVRAPPRAEPMGEGEAPAAGWVWFRIDVGREQNADPRWLVPLLCRRGGIDRGAIGRIRIYPTETRVQIAEDWARGFHIASRQPDEVDPHVHIWPLDAEARGPARPGFRPTFRPGFRPRHDDGPGPEAPSGPGGKPGKGAGGWRPVKRGR